MEIFINLIPLVSTNVEHVNKYSDLIPLFNSVSFVKWILSLHWVSLDEFTKRDFSGLFRSFFVFFLLLI